MVFCEKSTKSSSFPDNQSSYLSSSFSSTTAFEESAHASATNINASSAPLFCVLSPSFSPVCVFEQSSSRSECGGWLNQGSFICGGIGAETLLGPNQILSAAGFSSQQPKFAKKLF